MEHTLLGATGLTVSRIALGCMSFGDPAKGVHGWALDEEASQVLFRTAIELGITFWDTGNMYQGGTSEEYVGRALRRYSRREDVTLATKVFGRMHDGPTGGGLSRAAILEQADASLRRLGTDHIDLYYIHRFDPAVPVEETMEALHDLVVAGKVRALGASSMWAWQFAKLQAAADIGGWTPVTVMQNHYNLLDREDEREMIPLCADSGVVLVPYSPLARGLLARAPGASTPRSSSDAFALRAVRPSDDLVRAAVEVISRGRAVPMATVAIAWVLRHPQVEATIVGATRPQHLVDAAASATLALTDAESRTLQSEYEARAPGWV